LRHRHYVLTVYGPDQKTPKTFSPGPISVQIGIFIIEPKDIEPKDTEPKGIGIRSQSDWSRFFAMELTEHPKQCCELG
ncbi:hypothetical protein, partial [Algibacter sp. L4_22]|uniref:hypothetical protein n=1 Tax=Algibacter sp. L4_22 TaxID=2942477 RepID=UPI00201B5FF9